MMNQEAEESRAARCDESLLFPPPAGASALPRGPPGWELTEGLGPAGLPPPRVPGTDLSLDGFPWHVGVPGELRHLQWQAGRCGFGVHPQ